MKTLNRKNLIAIITSLFIAVILAIFVMFRNDAQYADKTMEYEALQKQAKEYEAIKTRWSVKSSQADFDFLLKHPKLLKQEKHGSVYVMEFDNLSAGEFDRITNRLLNSMLSIKKMTLKRNVANKGMIHAEIEE